MGSDMQPMLVLLRMRVLCTAGWDREGTEGFHLSTYGGRADRGRGDWYVGLYFHLCWQPCSAAVVQFLCDSSSVPSLTLVWVVGVSWQAWSTCYVTCVMPPSAH